MGKQAKKNAGMAMVEILIGSAIILSGILAADISYSTYIEYALANQRNVEASYLLEESLEAATFLRDKGWAANIATLATTTSYYLTFNGSYWATTTTPVYVDGIYLRTIQMGDVRRDGSDRIASVGTVDTNSKQVTATVAYFQGHATTTKVLTTYITNLYSN